MANDIIRKSIEIHNTTRKASMSHLQQPAGCANCAHFERRYNEERADHQATLKTFKSLIQRAKDAIEEAKVEGRLPIPRSETLQPGVDSTHQEVLAPGGQGQSVEGDD